MLVEDYDQKKMLLKFISFLRNLLATQWGIRRSANVQFAPCNQYTSDKFKAIQAVDLDERELGTIFDSENVT